MVTTLAPDVSLPHPPRRLPVLGDVIGMNVTTPVQDAVRLAQELGPIFERVVMGNRFVVVSGVDLVTDLNDDTRFTKHLGPAVEGLRSISGDGLFTAYSDEPNWRKAHDLLRPAFTQAAMRTYHDTMVEVTRDLLSYWRTSDRVDVSADMTKLTLETIGRTAFSYSFDAFTRSEPHPFVGAMVRTLTHNQRREVIRVPILTDLWFRNRDRRNEEDKAFLAGVIDDIVRTRRDHGVGQENDLLDIMLTAARDADPNALDEVNIRHQILTFLIAGHETTSGALSFALYYLSRDPELWAQARAEIDEVWGDGPPAFEQVAKARLVRRILDEALRLWPTAPGYARQALTDTVIGDGYRMKKGDWAMILIPGLHRDPVFGENTEEFDPDRFLSAAVRARPAQAYKPFGTGERACIGRQFAVHEAMIALGTVLQNVDVRPDPDYRLRIEERLTLMPKGFELSISPRRR